MDLPKVITTSQLVDTRPRAPRLSPEVIADLHPYGRHLVVELETYGHPGPSDSLTICSVLATARNPGGTFTFTHLLPSDAVEQLPDVRSVLSELVDHFERADAHRLACEVEAWLDGAARQQRLPFD